MKVGLSLHGAPAGRPLSDGDGAACHGGRGGAGIRAWLLGGRRPVRGRLPLAPGCATALLPSSVMTVSVSVFYGCFVGPREGRERGPGCQDCSTTPQRDHAQLLNLVCPVPGVTVPAYWGAMGTVCGNVHEGPVPGATCGSFNKW